MLFGMTLNALSIATSKYQLWYHPDLAERTQIGLLKDIPVDPELLDRVAGPVSRADTTSTGVTQVFFSLKLHVLYT